MSKAIKIDDETGNLVISFGGTEDAPYVGAEVGDKGIEYDIDNGKLIVPNPLYHADTLRDILSNTFSDSELTDVLGEPSDDITPDLDIDEEDDGPSAGMNFPGWS